MFHICLYSNPLYFSWNCESGPKLRKSFIYHLCTVWLGVQHLKLIWHWNAKPAKPASWRNSNGNSRVESQSWLQTDIRGKGHLGLPLESSLPKHAAKEVGECILCIITFESPQLFNTLHTFRHPCIVLNSCQWCFSDQLFNFQCFASFHIQLLSTSPLETARVARNCESHSFIICVQYALGLGVQHLKLIWHWNAKPAKPASWRNSNGNRFVCWAFCAPWTWKQTECFPLTFLGQHIMLLAKLAPISSYPALISCRSVACFRRPNFSIHYIPSGIPVLCWTHVQVYSTCLQKHPTHMLIYLFAPTSTWLSYYRCGTRVLLMSNDHNCFHIITSHAVAVDQKQCLSSLHHFWKTCFRWRKSTSLSWFLAAHLQPGKEHCCLLRCPTPCLDSDQPEYQPWCEAKRSMCIMPLLGANTLESKETRGPWGELAEGQKATMRSFLSSKANVSWHAAILKKLRGDMRGKLAPISSYPALIRCRSVACFRHPNFSIHYIPSGIPVLCWTHANGVSVINFLIFNVSHLFTFNSCPLLLLKLREWPETAKVIHLSFVYSMPWALVSNIENWFDTGMPNLPNLPHEGIRTETALCAGHSAPHEHGNKLNVSHWHFLANTSCCWRSLLPSQVTRHWLVAAQWHASDAPTFQYTTYLQAFLYCAELMSKYTPGVFKNIQHICSFTAFTCLCGTRVLLMSNDHNCFHIITSHAVAVDPR